MTMISIKYRGFGTTDVRIEGRGAVRVARGETVKVPAVQASDLISRGNWEREGVAEGGQVEGGTIPFVSEPGPEQFTTPDGEVIGPVITPWPGDGPEDPFAAHLDPELLMKHKRDELNVMATSLGISNAVDLPNKAAVVTAIMGAQS